MQAGIFKYTLCSSLSKYIVSSLKPLTVLFLPISFSLPSECSESCTLSQKDLNLLDNQISAIVLSLAPSVFCSPSHELSAIVSPS